MAAPDLSGYITVPERITRFRELHPRGCLRPVDPLNPFKTVELGSRVFITYAAAAYRDETDALPGIGVAWEPFPGKTPYTRDSELMNAETSAWGRAIVAVLAADTNSGIATADEIRNRHADDPATSPDSSYAEAARAAVSPGRAQELAGLALAAADVESLRAVWSTAGAEGAFRAEVSIHDDKADKTVTMTLQKYLEARGEELKLAKSDHGAEKGGTARTRTS